MREIYNKVTFSVKLHTVNTEIYTVKTTGLHFGSNKLFAYFSNSDIQPLFGIRVV